MAEVTIRTGTRDELAGVTIGSGNVWERPGRPGLSVRLALPEDDLDLAEGETVELGGHRCTLERIEALPDGAHHLHFRVEPLEADPAAGPGVPERPGPATPDGSEPAVRTVAVVTDPADDDREGPATRLRRATPALLALLGVDEGPGLDGWARTEREWWVEIDRVPCGPNTTTTWTWPTDGPTPAGARAEIVEEVVRRHPDDLHEVRVSGSWRRRARRIHVATGGTGVPGHLRVSAPPDLLDEVTALASQRLGFRPAPEDGAVPGR